MSIVPHMSIVDFTSYVFLAHRKRPITRESLSSSISRHERPPWRLWSMAGAEKQIIYSRTWTTPSRRTNLLQRLACPYFTWNKWSVCIPLQFALSHCVVSWCPATTVYCAFYLKIWKCRWHCWTGSVRIFLIKCDVLTQDTWHVCYRKSFRVAVLNCILF